MARSMNLQSKERQRALTENALALLESAGRSANLRDEDAVKLALEAQDAARKGAESENYQVLPAGSSN